MGESRSGQVEVFAPHVFAEAWGRTGKEEQNGPDWACGVKRKIAPPPSHSLYCLSP